MPVPSNIYKGQNYKLVLETYLLVVDATVKKILYQKPNGFKGEFAATADGTTLESVISADTNNIPGIWRFQAYVEIAGSKYYGDLAQLNILNTIKN